MRVCSPMYTMQQCIKIKLFCRPLVEIRLETAAASVERKEQTQEGTRQHLCGDDLRASSAELESVLESCRARRLQALSVRLQPICRPCARPTPRPPALYLPGHP